MSGMLVGGILRGTTIAELLEDPSSERALCETSATLAPSRAGRPERESRRHR